MTKKDAAILKNYLMTVANNVPSYRRELSEVLVFAALDLQWYCSTGHQSRSFQKALSFAKTVPKVTDFSCFQFVNWYMEDKEHTKYFKNDFGADNTIPDEH